jgi:hypothetical protein
MKFRMAVIVVLLVVCPALIAQTPAPQPKPVRATASQLSRAQASPAFQEAMLVLADQDEVVNLETTELVRDPKNRETFAIRFAVTRKGSPEPGEFARMIYVERLGKPASVYFAVPTDRFAKLTDGIVFQGCAGTPWVRESSICGGLFATNVCDPGRCDRVITDTRDCPGSAKRTRRTVYPCNCVQPPNSCIEIDLP